MKSYTNISKGIPGTEPVWSKRWGQTASCQKFSGESSITWGMPGAYDMTEQEAWYENKDSKFLRRKKPQLWYSLMNKQMQPGGRSRHTNHLAFLNILEWVNFTEFWAYMLKINKLCHYEVAIAFCYSHWWLLSTIYFALNGFHVGFTTAEIHICQQMHTHICHIQERMKSPS